MAGTHRTRNRPRLEAPSHPVSKRPLMQSVTLRLAQPIAHALRRAAIERSLDYREPFTQQAIAETALNEWLLHNGHATSE